MGSHAHIPCFVTALAALLLAATVQAAAPQTIGYQGYLTSNNGVPVSGSASVIFSLYSVATGGAAIWTETQPTVSVTSGNYNVLLGSVTPIALLFNAPYWLGVKVGADTEMAPRAALASVPYAFRAISVDSTAIITGTQVTGPVASATTATTAATAANFSGALAGDVTGAQIATTVTAIQCRAVSAGAPTEGQVLVFKSGQWQPPPPTLPTCWPALRRCRLR